MSKSAVEFEQLSKSFGTMRALTRVSGSLPVGSVGGLVGPNGAGKTTLFSLIAGYLSPDSGKLFVAGQRLRGATSRAGLLGILPQDALFQRGINIGRHFVWYARMAGMDRQAAEREAVRVLDVVGLRDSWGRQGDQLSHGMHKRAAIAQALIASPPLILLDEPTAGLDPANARQVRDLITSLRGECSVLVSSHNLEEIADICDHIMVLNRGEMAASQDIASMTKAHEEVRFELVETLSPAGREALLGLAEVTEVRCDGTTLICTLGNVPDANAAVGALVGLLSAQGIVFTGMQRGSTLEQRFLELTE
jgi:ABC-2 type transport system ATP-binding protein